MSHLADALLLQIRAAQLPEPATELLFHPSRRWRLDLAWTAERVAVEVHGGIWKVQGGAGRHTTGSGFQGDREKMNEAALLGWLVLEVTEKHIRSGLALRWVEAALRQGGRGEKG